MAEKNSLWKNIRNKAKQNRASGATPKKPTTEMLRQERKIKAKKADGGPINTLEGDLISKVIMNRNRDKDFVQRAYAVGEYPESNMFVQPDANEFGVNNSHLMGWGEDDKGQAYMYPEVMNPNNEAIKVPNQYADYISSTGYKKATGMPYAEGGYFPTQGPGKALFKGYADGGKYLTADGIAHKVYRGADGDIMVNHPKNDYGKSDTLNLTNKSNANTIAEGVASVKKWHRENPSYSQGGYTSQYSTGGYNMKKNNQSWRNYLQYAIGGKEGEDPFVSPLNQGAAVGKPAQEWLTNWVQDPEFSNRLNTNFPSKSTDLEKKIYGSKEARERASAGNLKSIQKNIPDLVNDINNTKFLYNTNQETNKNLLGSYKNSLQNPESIGYLEKQLSKNPQGFTDSEGRIVINNPQGYSPESIGAHELTHKAGMSTNRGYETLDQLMKGKFKRPLPDRIDSNYDNDEMYPFLMQMRFDNKFQPGEEITPERLKQIREAGPQNHLFKYYDDNEISNYLNTLASNTAQPNLQGPYTQSAAQGGYINGRKQYNVGGINSAASVGQAANTGGINQDAVMGAVSKGAGAIPGYGQAIQTGMQLNSMTADLGNSFMMNATPEPYKEFMAKEQQRGKWMNYINPAVGMAYRSIGAKGRLEDYKEEKSQEAATLGTAQFNAANPVEQISLNNPVAANGGYMTNNSLNLHNTMRHKKFAQGGTFDQYGINMIPDSAGLHHQSAYGGVPIGPNALAEGGEIKMDTGDGGQYIVSDQVDGAQTQKDFTFSKGGKYK